MLAAEEPLVFDLESDGLLDDITKIHCIHVKDRATGKSYRFNEGWYYDLDGNPVEEAPRDGSVEDGVRFLHDRYVAGQNIIGYDVPAIQKLYPWFKPRRMFDTKVAAQVIWTNLIDVDMALLRRGKLPEEFRRKGLIGRNSLEAWGYRLGDYKGDFNPKDYGHTWKTMPFTKDMDTYGAQDVVVTDKFVDKIKAKNYSDECLEIEHATAIIIGRQERRGFAFDHAVADKLVAVLQVRRAELEAELAAIFPPWQVLEKSGISKVNNKKLGRVKGEYFEKWKTVVFNPGSRDHIADRLMTLRGWEPTEFTDKGKPKVDESVLESLPWPEAKVLAEYFMVQKRLGQICDGDKSWFRYERNGRIHGRVNTNGAVTGRMTHDSPNVAQVPKVGVPYGKECRSCFMATPGLMLVGCDAEGLELRMLGHYMARWDGGAYSEAVVNGRKEDETDVHNVNKRAAGLNLRDSSKTFIYALIYGAGDFKLGTIVFEDFTEEQKAAFLKKHKTDKARQKALVVLGRERRDAIMRNLPALGKLVDAVKAKVRKTKQLVGLDGRILHIRSEHAALNTLLQSGGAVAMKKALILLDEDLQAAGFRPLSPDELGPFAPDALVYEFVANVHDEFQAETTPEQAHDFGRRAADAIRRAGEHFGLRCPLAGAFDVGANWAATH